MPWGPCLCTLPSLTHSSFLMSLRTPLSGGLSQIPSVPSFTLKSLPCWNFSGFCCGCVVFLSPSSQTVPSQLTHRLAPPSREKVSADSAPHLPKRIGLWCFLGLKDSTMDFNDTAPPPSASEGPSPFCARTRVRLTGSFPLFTTLMTPFYALFFIRFLGDSSKLPLLIVGPVTLSALFPLFYSEQPSPDADVSPKVGGSLFSVTLWFFPPSFVTTSPHFFPLPLSSPSYLFFFSLALTGFYSLFFL